MVLFLLRAVEKLNAKGTYKEQKSAYSELQLYPSVTICINPGAVRSKLFPSLTSYDFFR